MTGAVCLCVCVSVGVGVCVCVWVDGGGRRVATSTVIDVGDLEALK